MREHGLREVCVRCGTDYGEHRHMDDRCPTDDGWAKEGAFQAKIPPVKCARCGVTTAERPSLPFQFDEQRRPVCEPCAEKRP